ncbi:MAG TPA: pyridoxal phosphate-dependent aminotransferase [Pseudogracilibacillus sp.]|nr:pyridoxal phosphate-dependent aminotransferase [Pseudogracilibacillus sp.]
MNQFEKSDALNRLPEQFFAQLAHTIQSHSQQGHDVIDLGRGNPDTKTPDYIVKALQEAAEEPINHKYAPFRGFSYLKEAIAAFYKKEYNVDIDPETEVSVLFGSKTGLIHLSQCLLNPGDTALLPDPGYPDYETGIALANANIETFPLLEENQFLPDYKTIPSTLLDQVKVMFLNYPNNPTAATADQTTFEETVAVANEHNLAVIHDFAYGAFGFDDEKPISFLQSPGAKDVGIETYTLSKTYNMAGWRVGFALGNPSIIEHINQLQDHMYASIFGGIQAAAAEALHSDQQFVQELNQMYEKRRNAFIEALHQIGWDVTPPPSTFFCWLPVPKGYTSESFADLLLNEAHVGVAPGNGFGEFGEGYIRVGLLDTEERLIEAAQRIGKLGIFS